MATLTDALRINGRTAHRYNVTMFISTTKREYVYEVEASNSNQAKAIMRRKFDCKPSSAWSVLRAVRVD